MGKTKRYNGDDDRSAERFDWKEKRRKNFRQPKVSKQLKELQERGIPIPIKNF